MNTCRILNLILLAGIQALHGGPAEGEASAPAPAEGPRSWWSYQPPRMPALPQVRNEGWVTTEIDRFVLARIEAAGLNPVNDADRVTLVRRAYYDLIGLPPTPEEIDAFLRDTAPDAFARLVDRLLSSPQFGERWGRHWLDVVRFGESVTLRGLIFKQAWRYRDYVIDAFNRDLPYNRFLQEQVAGDLMPAESLAEQQRQLTATTFLVLGNTNFEEQDKRQLDMDVVDEQLDTIGKAFLAQTIGCARCHDHKFDPIPTRDYYAMAGILRNSQSMEHANVSGWVEVPLPVDPETEAILKKHETAIQELEQRVKQAKAKATALAKPKDAAGPSVLPVDRLSGIVLDDARAKRVGEWKHSQYSGRYVGDGYLHDLNSGKGEKTLTFQPEITTAGVYEVRLAYAPGENRAAAVPITILSAEGETTVQIDQRKSPPIDGRFVSLGQFRFEKNGQGYVLVANEGTSGYVIVDAVQFIPAGEAGSLAATADTQSAPVHVADREAAQAAADEVKRLEAELKRLRAEGPKRPMVMSVKETAKPSDTHVHVRGSVHRLGDPVPRGFLQVATAGDSLSIPDDASGRLELGQWLTDPANPLTARVMANRVWHWLLGEGLVRTPDNFGTTGEQPSHPELLDYLALSFMDQGWSVKRLVRQIMLSHVYQLSTEPNQAAVRTDPENRLFWRMNRRRLEAEAIRDTMLWISGELKLNMGGPTIAASVASDYAYVDDDTRRSVYVPVLRNALPELFEAFDFPDPSMVTGQRNTSTVAPQALFLMNNPFVIERARRAAERLLKHAEAANDEQLVAGAFRWTLGREPAEKERSVALSHLASAGAGGERVERLAELFQALFASVDFRYLN